MYATVMSNEVEIQQFQPISEIAGNWNIIGKLGWLCRALTGLIGRVGGPDAEV